MTHTLTKAITALTLAVASFLPANAQDAFFVYRNDGQFNVFYNDMIDSIVFSEIDLDSIVHEEFVVQEFHTPDSIYRIPIASIDSVGFQKPGTIYEKDVIQLNGNLFDYLISEDSMSLIFDSTIPSSLLPKVGDKLATVELSDKLPFGFAGLVREVQEDSCGYIVSCDTLQFEEVMYRFYGVNEIVLKQEEPQISYFSKSYSRPFYIDPIKWNDIPIEYSWALGISPNGKTYFGKECGARSVISLEMPTFNGIVTYVIDKIISLSYYNINADIDIHSTTRTDIVGKTYCEHTLLENPNPTTITPWGIPFYFNPKLTIGVEGEIVVGFTNSCNVHFDVDIVYYPYSAVTPAFPIASTLINTQKCIPKVTYTNTEWEHIAGNVSIQAGFTAEIGIGFKECWIGGEYGTKGNFGIEIDLDMENLEKLLTSSTPQNTRLYDTLKDVYVERKFDPVINILSLNADIFGKGNVKFNMLSIDLPTINKKTWDFLPKFAATRATGNKKNADVATLEASTCITNDCIMPYTVGFTLFDNDGNMIGTPQWREEPFKTIGDEPFIRYAKTWDNIETGKKYHVYPTLKLFGIDVLATPKDDIAFGAIKTLEADPSVNSATLHGHFKWEEDYESILTYGFIYGENKSLTIDSGTNIVAAGNNNGNYTASVEGLSEETTYYYRAYLFVDGEYFYAEEVKSFKTKKKEISEEVDLGLSVNWRGWNVGATKPEEYGNYFAWGETSQKEYYAWQSYFENPYDENNEWIGSATTTDVAGTDKDAATVILGEKWRMPTYEEVKELMGKCSWTWSDYNGVKGYTVESNVAGYEGNFIFLPAAGNYDKTSIKQEGSYGGYWSSTPLDSESKAAAYIFYFYGETIHSTQSSNRYTGRTIRPVTPKEDQ